LQREFEACRELEKSARSASEAADSKSPNLLISPLGLILNRVFVVGVLTELDSIGTQNEMWKARYTLTRTGAIYVYTQDNSSLMLLFSFQRSRSLLS